MRKTIINLTQHTATPDQTEEGVFSTFRIMSFANMTNFVGMPTHAKIVDTAKAIAKALRVEVDSWHFTNEETTKYLWGDEVPMERTLEHFYSVGNRCRLVMIGGAPWFMSSLELALIKEGFTPIYAFSERVSVDVPQEDGSVKKTNEFKHVGFINKFQ